MILDAIIGLLLSMFGWVAAATTGLVAPIVNLVLTGVETVVRLFVAGFSLGRMQAKEAARESAMSGAIILGTVVLVIVIGFFGPRVTHRQITLVAEDGHSLPFAALVVRARGNETHLRTDNAGNARIPRFGLESVTLQDPRYVRIEWRGPEIERRLIASRTILGSALDRIADRLLQPEPK